MFSKPKSYIGDAGLPPGTLSIPDEAKPQAVLHLMDYSGDNFRELSVDSVEEFGDSVRDSATVSWLNIDGIYDSTVLEDAGAQFSIHPLVLEDIQNVEQRPKVEDYGEYLFLTFKMLSWDEEQGQPVTEQVSLILGSGYVLSFQERSGDVFELVRSRIRLGRGRIRVMGTDYLALALLDAVVDNYFLVMERLELEFEALEEEVLIEKRKDSVQGIHDLKRKVAMVRRSVWPLRDMLSEVARVGAQLIDTETMPFFKDVYDHALQIFDSVEMFREMLTGLLDFHATNVSNDMNSVMKVLTIFVSVFTPLTFIAGIYGMNFQHMPELAVGWAYPAVLGVMACVGVGMILFFKVKRWL
jgi:magnesium transporter